MVQLGVSYSDEYGSVVCMKATPRVGSSVVRREKKKKEEMAYLLFVGVDVEIDFLLGCVCVSGVGWGAFCFWFDPHCFEMGVPRMHFPLGPLGQIPNLEQNRNTRLHLPSKESQRGHIGTNVDGTSRFVTLLHGGHRGNGQTPQHYQSSTGVQMRPGKEFASAAVRVQTALLLFMSAFWQVHCHYDGTARVTRRS